VCAPTQHATRSVTGVFARVQQGMSDSAKILRQGDQGPNDATTQQVDTSTMTSVSATATPDRNNTGANTMQKHGVMDASLMSELAAQTPQFGLNVTNQFSPMLSQDEAPSGVNAPSSSTASGIR